jgi:hypothetical protein
MSRSRITDARTKLVGFRDRESGYYQTLERRCGQRESLRLSNGLQLAIDDSDLFPTKGGQHKPVEPLVVSAAIVTEQA